VSQLAVGLRERGFSVHVRINDQDMLTTDVLPLDRDEVLRSIAAELALEEEWRRYLSPGNSHAGLSALMIVRRAYRTIRLAPPWKRSLDPDDPGIRMLRRLVNIELSHLDLMRQAVDVQSSWALIVEDDAWTKDAPQFADDLAKLVKARANEPQPAFVNISESFGHGQLGTQEHLQSVGTWSATAGVTGDLLSASRPVTNTVCAILYRTAFLRELVLQMDAIPISPVLPIDWKLNRALLTMFHAGHIGAGDCWTVSPAPLLQRSMHKR
jgi:hypothetical protein